MSEALAPNVRFWRFVEKTATCWLWTGGTSAGYGDFYLRKKRDGANYHTHAHRVSWMLMHGEIEDGLYVLHKCDNRLCVRPSHLYLGTHDDNMRDMIERKGHWHLKTTHCPSGHPYDEANTYSVPSRPGWRYCKACMRAQIKRRSEEARERKNNRRLNDKSA